MIAPIIQVGTPYDIERAAISATNNSLGRVQFTSQGIYHQSNPGELAVRLRLALVGTRMLATTSTMSGFPGVETVFTVNPLQNFNMIGRNAWTKIRNDPQNAVVDYDTLMRDGYSIPVGLPDGVITYLINCALGSPFFEWKDPVPHVDFIIGDNVPKDECRFGRSLLRHGLIANDGDFTYFFPLAGGNTRHILDCRYELNAGVLQCPHKSAIPY